MSKTDWKDTEIRRLRLYQPLELNIIRRAFPAVDDLLAELWDLQEASDPRMSKPIGLTRGSGEEDGTETRGSEEGRSGRVAMRGGFASEAAQNQMVEVNRRLGRLAAEVFDGLDRPGRRTVGIGMKKRRCRREECAEKDRRQYGMWDPKAAVHRCRTCNMPLAS